MPAAAAWNKPSVERNEVATPGVVSLSETSKKGNNVKLVQEACRAQSPTRLSVLQFNAPHGMTCSDVTESSSNNSFIATPGIMFERATRNLSACSRVDSGIVGFSS